MTITPPGSAKLRSIEESATLAMAAKTRALKAQGLDILNLTLGEPDFNTPDHVKAAAIQAIQDNITQYPPLNGYPELRTAVAAFLNHHHGTDYVPNEIMVSTGAKQSLYNVFTALLNPGDEVIIPAPFWVSYASMVQMADGVPVLVYAGTEQGYKITPAQLEAALTPRTRLFLFNSPSNPTGMVYTPEETRALFDVLAARPEIFVVSDEIYTLLSYDTQVLSPATLPGFRERTVTINGVSKAFAMTGWRIGFTAAPEWIIQLCSKFQGQVTSGASSISQMAALAAMTGPMEPTWQMKAAYKARRDKGLARFAELLPEVQLPTPEGAFYFYADVSAFLGKHSTDGQVMTDTDALALYLLDKARVSTVSGTAFGSHTHIRLSYATSEEVIAEAISRMAQALYALK
ncbi:MAG: pyridoxal phosphate-dependent aminotransferase [Bacteroidetes bacterium]|nr:pyridoxal phosphate-dependent aminotransferase [Bacteroidota bacterium]